MARECIPGCDPSDCQCSATPAGGGFLRARGILAGARGDALPEVRIRRLRDAWDWPDIDEQECVVCGGPWDGHVTLRELTAPSDGYRICGPCDRGEQPEYDEVSGGMEYVRSEQRDGRVTWAWAFVSRTPEIDEQTRAQQAAMRNPEAQRG